MLAADGRQIFGIDLGGTKCAASELRGDTVEEFERIPTGGFEPTFAYLIRKIGERCDGRPVHVGVSCGGPADYRRGIIGTPPNLPPDWHNVALLDELNRHLGGTACLMNDANACALAEWMFGAGRGCSHMIFITAGTGFGAGLILNGALYRGATGDAGEIGHVRLTPEGPIGFGKAGSVEGYCSGGGMVHLARLMIQAVVTAALPAWTQQAGGFTAKTIVGAARQGDALAQAVVREAGQKLGETLAMLIDLFNPERIVLGGLFPRCQDLWANVWPETLRKEALPGPARACRILPATLGEMIGSHGAIAAALYPA